MFMIEPIRNGAKPDLKLLADVLRSDMPIPAEIRSWLADMFDKDAKSAFQFKTLSKRGRGAKPSGVLGNWETADMVNQLMSDGLTRQQAIHQAAEHFEMTRSTVEVALKLMKSAQEENDAITREEMD